MADLQLIVDKLNAPPFRRKHGLVSFDELSPPELLSTLNSVLVELDPSNAVSNEAPDRAGQRIAEFLHLLRYPLPADQ